MSSPATSAQLKPDAPFSLDLLAAAVRPEFAVECYFPDPDDPVLGGGRCAVASCSRLSWGRGLCGSHYDRWHRAGKPDLTEWLQAATPLAPRAGVRKTQCFDLRPLGERARLELAYALQSRHDARGFGPSRPQVARAVKLLVRANASSVLERSPGQWRVLAQSWGWRDLSCIAFLAYAHRVVEDVLAQRSPGDEYARDTWDARRLGLPARPPNYLVRFGGISQLWLREAAKTWARFRLATGRAVGTVCNDAHGLSWFSRFLASVLPEAGDEGSITRPVLEEYLSHLASAGLADQTRLGYLVSLRIFLDHCRRQQLLSGLPTEAQLYPCLLYTSRCV